MQGSNSFRSTLSWLQGIYSSQTLRGFSVSHVERMNMTRSKEFNTMMALAALFFLSGCHLIGVGAASGALTGGAVAGRPGAMIGGGSGLLVGAVAEALMYSEHPKYSPCHSFRSLDERQACEEGRAETEGQNGRDRIQKAERYGYETYRQPSEY